MLREFYVKQTKKMEDTYYVYSTFIINATIKTTHFCVYSVHTYLYGNGYSKKTGHNISTQMPYDT